MGLLYIVFILLGIAGILLVDFVNVICCLLLLLSIPFYLILKPLHVQICESVSRISKIRNIKSSSIVKDCSAQCVL